MGRMVWGECDAPDCGGVKDGRAVVLIAAALDGLESSFWLCRCASSAVRKRPPRRLTVEDKTQDKMGRPNR